jgi:hypothetical protein
MVFCFRAVAITYDTWTALSHHCYLTLTGHFLYNDTVAQCTLSFIDCSESHKSDNLARLIEDTLRTHYNDLNIVACVSDNAKNMIATAKKLNFSHLGCFLHATQLVIRDALLDTAPNALKEKLKEKDRGEEIDFDA